MSLSSALQAGVSGLLGQSTRLAAISDNIANSSTIGFKRSDVDFTSLFIGGNDSSFSASGTLPNVRTDISLNGTITTSSNSTDLAINGRGMFVVTPAVDGTGVDNFALTRAGQFSPDANGFLRNTAGLFLQGFALNPDGSFANGVPNRDSFASLQPINVNAFNNIGTPTTNIELQGNLPAQLTGPTPGGPFETSVEYFSALGESRTLSLVWTPGAANSYTVDFLDNGAPLAPPIPPQTISFNDGSVAGTIAGAPDFSGAPLIDDVTGTLNLTVNGGTQTLGISFGASNSLSGITQFVGDNSVRAPVRMAPLPVNCAVSRSVMTGPFLQCLIPGRVWQLLSFRSRMSQM